MSSDRLDIGDRMKRYEAVTAWTLPRRVPVILRVDGRAFHTITRQRFGRAWSMEFAGQMATAAIAVMEDMQGCSFAYSQSDEISFLLTDYATIRTEAWFGYDARKMISIAASLTSAYFSQLYGRSVAFDARVFSVPIDEVCNYFIWRQIDATRNAIQMAGHEHFSPKELHGVSCNQIQEKLFQEKHINFDTFPVMRKRGFCVIEKKIDWEPPIFTQDRDYIERHVNIRED